MRLVICHNQQEVIPLMVGEKVDRPIRNPMSVAHLRRPGRILPGRGSPGPLTVLSRELRQISAHIVPKGSIPSWRRHSGIEVICSREMPFAHKGAFDAAIMQSLADRMRRVSQRHAVRHHAVGMRIESRPDGRPCGRAHRLTVVGPVKSDTLCGKTIEIRSL